jgi:hypothetical protein
MHVFVFVCCIVVLALLHELVMRYVYSAHAFCIACILHDHVLALHVAIYIGRMTQHSCIDQLHARYQAEQAHRQCIQTFLHLRIQI